MSTIINGKIFRNVEGGDEGIDTPSLKINGQPLSGGTQLYQHKLHFSNDYDVKLITLNSTKITNATLSNGNGTRDSAIAIIYDSGSGGVNMHLWSDGGEWKLKCQDAYYDDFYSISLGTFVSDTVTAL